MKQTLVIQLKQVLFSIEPFIEWLYETVILFSRVLCPIFWVIFLLMKALEPSYEDLKIVRGKIIDYSPKKTILYLDSGTEVRFHEYNIFKKKLEQINVGDDVLARTHKAAISNKIQWAEELEINDRQIFLYPEYKQAENKFYSRIFIGFWFMWGFSFLIALLLEYLIKVKVLSITSLLKGKSIKKDKNEQV